MLRPELGPDERDVRLEYVAMLNPSEVLGAQPLLLLLVGEARLVDGVASNFAHVRHGEVEGRSRYGVLLQEGVVGHVEEERVISGEGHVHSSAEEFRKRVILHLRKEEVVGQGGDREANLVQIVQVLQRDLLGEVDAVVDGLAKEVGGREMHHVSSLPGVGSERKCIEPLGLSEAINDLNVSPKVVELPCVRRVVVLLPLGGRRAVARRLRVPLVVNGVETDDVVEEFRNLRMLRAEGRERSEGGERSSEEDFESGRLTSSG
jgi:hypothetical protein